ncbi:MAG: bifunctional demethylmenaquinone methyltransferase/2-methoxy-6-polyprenyl-1,4-benzoquinol methylase UbiE [Limosilactobacillus sp.]|uniref:bifunctional demethylmenaquinone methyltransferase/2-methoxy-6-polyprenyl-1,4-benzoquinol methylase UbiE n=1 Tax=Limosilactobacillus sp. TaxID=2773925 RepID=UPI00270F9F1D|nr:bifunctional demethylmenaquinone methyltransferase/2-methoxy-6-polyprenyl-1,4-benzoquinol methylase UbiE [Limosilactobacillus sp.]
MTRTNPHDEADLNRMFSRIAGKYDLMNDVISLGTQKQWKKKLFQELDMKSGMDCLDICCGTGDLTIELAKRSGRTGRTIGLDFNQDMLNLAEQKVRSLDLSKDIELIQADAMHLPFADDSFDVVTVGFGLRNVPDANQVLREITRVLKPGGQFATVEMSQPTSPVVKVGWKAYFKVFPRLAQVFGANVSDYKYLKETAEHFVSAQELLQMMKKVGLHNCYYRKLNLGAGALHIGRK